MLKSTREHVRQSKGMYWVFNITEEHYRHFVMRVINDDEVYCGLLQCQKEHVIYHMKKEKSLPMGIYILKRDNINCGCIEYIFVWDKKWLFETRNSEYIAEVKPDDLHPNPFLKQTHI